MMEKAFPWNEDGESLTKYRESSIKNGVTWDKDRFSRGVSAQGLSMRFMPIIREMNSLHGGMGIQVIED
jgi:hypothetical protein